MYNSENLNLIKIIYNQKQYKKNNKKKNILVLVIIIQTKRVYIFN
jgi:hypothetical protein